MQSMGQSNKGLLFLSHPLGSVGSSQSAVLAPKLCSFGTFSPASVSKNFLLLDYSEVLFVVQNILQAKKKKKNAFHRAERGHTRSYLLSDIISHTLGFKLTR